MKKIIFAIFAAIIFIACGNTNNNQEVLKVGTSADYPPFEYLDSANKITGFDIDLLEEISKKTGIKFEVQNIQFDGLIPALVSGKIDAAISSMSATQERRKTVDFSDTYFTTQHLFISKKGTDFKDKSDLKDKKVGVQVGTLQETFARTLEGVTVVPFESTPNVFLSLKAGKIDALITDSSLGYEFIKKSPDTFEDFYSEPDGSEGLSIAFKKDKFKNEITKINQALNEIKKDGILDILTKKYNLK